MTPRCAARRLVAYALCLMGSVGAAAAPSQAQHVHPPAGTDSARRDPRLELVALAGARMGSGTSWVPDAMLMRGAHIQRGSWALMLDGNAALHYVRTSGTRRQWQIGSTNWAMVMADRALAGGVMQLRGMLSAEPATLTSMGYPLLLQRAEPYRGGTVTDRQHPHELLSEIAVRYSRPLGANVAAEIYLAPAGEPAIGPVAYRHRPSAANDPATPLGHHTQDATHTTFGVATVGVFTRFAKLEGSVFNGRHPDDTRTNLELRQARLDSYAGRLTVNPWPTLSFSGSFAYITGGGEGLHAAHTSLHRIGASAIHVLPTRRGTWSTAVIYGTDLRGGGEASLPSVLVETNAEIGATAIFGRAEQVRRSAGDLALTGSVRPEVTVRALSVGASRALASLGGLGVSLAARGTVNLLPRELEPFYGSRLPLGLFAYLSVRPKAPPPRPAQAVPAP